MTTAMDTIDQAMACVSASSGGIGLGAVQTCALAAAHIAIGLRINDLQGDLLSDERQQNLLEFRRQYEAAQANLADLSDQLVHASEVANTSLSLLRSGRTSARRSLARAMFLSTDETGRHYAVNTVMRRRYNTLRVRYERACRSAVQMAELARLALEQRLGLSLMSVNRDDLSLVDNPHEWANSACSSTGIDYTVIRAADEITGDNYADAYIGDYVRNLERFFETYRLDYPYVDGRESVVLSLRNDVAQTTEACVSPVWNLLGASNDLTSQYERLPSGAVVDEAGVDDSGGVPIAWAAYGCAPSGDDVLENCALVSPLDRGPPVPDTTGRTPPAPFRISFATGSDEASPPPMTFTDAAEWAQEVEVPPGVYRLSWYVRDALGPQSHSASLVSVASVDAGVVSASAAVAIGAVGEWRRFVQFVDVPDLGVVRVRIVPDPTLPFPTEQHYDLAGLQLEPDGGRLARSVDSIDAETIAADSRAYWPRDFVGTTSRGTAVLLGCEDTDGSTFRRRFWGYLCDARLCDAGVDRCRDGEEGERLCYWESPPIDLSPEQFEEGGLFERAGLARGNFNYRMDTVALNFVGTGSRVCSDPSRSSSCYSSGFVQYTLYHDGPYPVINRSGDAGYRAPIFDARIEHASGLAAERLITNPVSSADAALLASYTRSELRGRPMSGRLRLRVWDTGDVNFAGIEDVQVVLGYRYFTRAGD